ncbi:MULTISPECIES: peptidylprolyl isomerase [Actinokineospora]|uniref:Peptidylprolyl isomerase n=1 Tax=Actinokineospora fastidiosa TaxID=1816 RepID=A0A918GNA3_9PSEU|nr:MULTISPECIES: peptidylprolyl isomerase [Actinokineospora]UVS78256.1 Peptidyl-prolyl cis-trans isomerase B [Actinokineospora sp. UTMC 2448]GGS48531.1 peptidylprolyl isomerase [Actinokineospora fastidiosa]
MPTNQQRREAAKRKLERQMVRRAERAKKRRIFAVGATVIGVVLVVGLIYWLTTIGGDDTTDPAAQTDTTAPEATPDVPASIPTELAAVPKRPKALPATTTCEYRTEEGAEPAKEVDAPPTADVSATGTVQATIKLSTGDVKATLDRALAPCTVNSFVSLAKQGYFADAPCHRLTTGEGLQVLQCGDPTGTGSGGPGYVFDNETFPEIKYGRGILAMANAGGTKKGEGTNGSQFFIVYGSAELPPDYTVFGSIDAESMKVIDEIAKAGTISQGMPGDGKPKTEVAITAVEIA